MNLDELIEQSRSIHDDLLKTIGRLDAFCQALSAEAELLRDQIGTRNAGDLYTGNEPRSSASSNSEAERERSYRPDTGERS